MMPNTTVIAFLSQDPREAAQLLRPALCESQLKLAIQYLTAAHRVLDGKYTVPEGKSRARWVHRDRDLDENLPRPSSGLTSDPLACWVRDNFAHYEWMLTYAMTLVERLGAKKSAVVPAALLDAPSVLRKTKPRLQPPPQSVLPRRNRTFPTQNRQWGECVEAFTGYFEEF